MAQLLSGTRIYGTGTVDSQLFINGNTAATSTNTGALQVVGGVGVGGNLFVGGTLYASAVTGNITTATNLAGGNTSQLAFQTASGVTGFVNSGTAGQILVSAGSTSTGPTFTNTSSIRVGFADNASTLLSGTAQSIVYQSSTGTTAFLAASTSGYLLSTQGTGAAPTWISQASITAGGVDTVKTEGQVTSSTFYPVFVNSNNSSATGEYLYTTSSFSINPYSGHVGISKTNPSAPLEIGDENQFSDDPWIRVRSTTSNVRSAFIQLIGRQVGVDETWNMIAAGSGLGNAGLRFTRGDWITGTMAMVIDSSGNVGIGTGPTQTIASTYGSDLVVHRGATRGGGGADTRIAISNTSTTGASNLRFYTSATSYLTAEIAVGGPGYTSWAGALSLNFLAVQGGPIAFHKGGVTLGSSGSATELMRITPNGAIAFSGATNYGSSGNVLVSQGDAAPQWTAIGAISAGQATTATNLAGGNVSQLAFQTAIGKTSFVSSGTAGQILVSAGGISTGPVFTNTSSIMVGVATNAINASTLLSGTAQSIVYQSAANTTAFLAATTSGYLLSTQGTGAAPAWISQASITAGGVDTIKTVGQASSATYYPTFVSANNASATGMSMYTTSSFVINPATGNVGIGTISPNAKLDVSGSGRFLNPVNGTTGAVVLRSDITNTATTWLQWTNNTSTIQYGAIGVTTTTDIIFLNSSTVAVERMRITANGGITFGGATNYGATGNVLVSQGDAAPQWTSVGAITAGQATTATNLAGGTAGQLHYQTSPGITSFAGPGTAGNVLVSNGTSAPTYNNTLTLAGTTTATNTTTGALQVRGGVGIGQALWVGSNANIGLFNGSTFTNITTLQVTNSLAITNYSGNQWLVMGNQDVSGVNYPSAIRASSGQLSFGNGDNWANTWTSSSASLPAGTFTERVRFSSTGIVTIYTNTNATSTNSGALQVIGGVGIGGDLWVGGTINGSIVGSSTTATNLAGGTAAQLAFQVSPGKTSFAGPGTAGQILVSAGSTSTGPVFTNTSTIRVGFATNATTLENGTAQSIHYQSAIGVTAFLAAGTSGQVLQTNGTGSAPTWVNQSSVISGNATTATNLAGGNASQLAFQTAPGVTSFVSSGTAGQILVSAGSTSTGPVFTNTSTIRVGFATNATTLENGTAQSIHYQSAIGVTAFLAAGTSGQVLQTNGTGSAPTWVNQSSVISGNATTATNLAGGTANAIPYQSSAGTTAFLAATTSGYVLATQGTGSAPTWVSQSSITSSVGDSLKTVSTATSAKFYPTFVDTNNASPTAKQLYTTSSISVNPGTGDVSAPQFIANNAMILNTSTVMNSYTIPTGYNAMSVGPISVSNGVTVTISSGQRWVIL